MPNSTNPPSNLNPNVSQNDRFSLANFFWAFWQSAKHEWHFLSHHGWDFAMMFWLPIMLVFSVWWVFSKGSAIDLPIAVIDNSHTTQSATLIRYIDATPEVNVVKQFYDTATAKKAIEATEVYAVVEIPDDFSRQLLGQKPTRVLLNVNAQFGTHSGMIQKGVQTAVSTFSAGVEMQRRVAKGEDITLVRNSYAPIQTQTITLFNAGNNYKQFLAVTVLPALLHILSMVIGASTVGRELRDKTLGEWYQDISNKTQKNQQNQTIVFNEQNPKLWRIIAGLNGKLIAPMLAYALWGAVVLVLITQIFAVQLSALLITYLILLMFMMVSFWMGVIVTVGTFSYRQGLSFTGFISAPSFAFSGVTFPYLAMSPAAQRWSNALPLTHYLRMQTNQLQMSAPIHYAMPTFYGFFIAVIVSLLIASLLTKKALRTPQKWGQR